MAKAAELCPKILKREGALWEKWIIEFARRRELQEIGAYIPIANPQLRDYVYEMVLNHYLRHDAKGFYTLITEWPHTIYNIHNLITTVQERVKENPDIQLMDALATLYVQLGVSPAPGSLTGTAPARTGTRMISSLIRPCIFTCVSSGRTPLSSSVRTALLLLLLLPFVLTVHGVRACLVGKYNLFHAIQDKVLLLIECDKERAIKLFVDNVDKVPVRRRRKHRVQRARCNSFACDFAPRRSRPWCSSLRPRCGSSTNTCTPSFSRVDPARFLRLPLSLTCLHGVLAQIHTWPKNTRFCS